MRFAGPATGTDPTKMDYVTQRMAGEIRKTNPGLVERITEAIIPGYKAMQHGGNE